MNPLNLEAAVLGVHSVLGVLEVVAGRFWCSYARVSLTPTTPARPRAPVFCTRARARGVEGARVRSSRRWCTLCAAVCTLCGVL